MGGCEGHGEWAVCVVGSTSFEIVHTYCSMLSTLNYIHCTNMLSKKIDFFIADHPRVCVCVCRVRLWV